MTKKRQKTTQAHTDRAVTLQTTRPPAADGTKKPPYIFIATPMYGGSCTAQYLVGLLHLCRSLDGSGLRYELAILTRESLITRARNKLVADFRRSSCTHLLFIDADIGFSARDVKPLVEADLDVVCGAYPMKATGWANVAEAAKAGKTGEELAESGARYAINLSAPAQNGAPVQGLHRAGVDFMEVQDAATGFLLLKREAIERYIAHYGTAIEYMADYEPNVGETHHMVFQADRDPVAVAQGTPARYLSEDYHFSRQWQRMGGQVWLCLAPKLKHVGVHEFSGNVSALFVRSSGE